MHCDPDHRKPCPRCGIAAGERAALSARLVDAGATPGLPLGEQLEQVLDAAGRDIADALAGRDIPGPRRGGWGAATPRLDLTSWGSAAAVAR